MNRQAALLEERLFNRISCREMQICGGWILKIAEDMAWISPIYGIPNDDIKTRIGKCEQISRQKNIPCSFRIIDQTNYLLRFQLMEDGYQKKSHFLIGERILTEEDTENDHEHAEYSPFFLRRGEKDGSWMIVENQKRETVGFLDADFLFLPDGDIFERVDIQKILDFSLRKNVSEILVSFLDRDELPDFYQQLGFVKAYTYSCYQK